MTAVAKPLTEIAAHWREARQLYTIYSSLLERFALGLPPCRDLESPIDKNEPEAIQRIQSWFAQMDERVHVHQLRQLLQTSRLGTEDNLHSLISHHLKKEPKTDSDRDKVDFLLVQYLSSCAPPKFYEQNVGFEEVSQALEPVLGEVGTHPPDWAKPLDQAIDTLDGFQSLRALLEQRTLEEMRKLKSSAGEMYFGPTALVAITRFNFLVRRAFVRLIAADLHAIRMALHKLEKHGIHTVDCSRAGLSSQEKLQALRQICEEWKKPFRAAYAAGQNFKELIEIRASVEEALVHGSDHAPKPTAQTSRDIFEPAQHEKSEVKEFSYDDFSRASDSTDKAASISLAPVGKTESHHKPEIEPYHHSEGQKSKETAVSDVEEPSDDTPAASSSADSAKILELPQMVEQIAQQLASNHVKAGSIATIMIGELKLMLSSWEVVAFVKGGDDIAGILQRAVGSRAVLLDRMDKRKRGSDATSLRAALGAARLVHTKIQDRIVSAKAAKDIDSAVNLAASCKRLVQLIEESEKLSK